MNKEPNYYYNLGMSHGFAYNKKPDLPHRHEYLLGYLKARGRLEQLAKERAEEKMICLLKQRQYRNIKWL